MEAKPKYCSRCGKIKNLCSCAQNPKYDSIIPVVPCPSCGNDVHGSDMYCEWCREDLRKIRKNDYKFLLACKGDPGDNDIWCPNCEKAIPSNAGVCPHCMTSLSINSKTFAKENMGQNEKAPASSGTGFTTTGVIARAAGVIVIILMFMPWISIPELQSYQFWTAKGVGSYPSEFAVYNFGTLGNALTNLYGSNAFGAATVLFLALWFVALILLIAGLLKSFLGSKDLKTLAIGGVVSALVAAFWAMAVYSANGSYTHAMSLAYGFNHNVLDVTLVVYAVIACGALTTIFSITKGNHI